MSGSESESESESGQVGRRNDNTSESEMLQTMMNKIIKENSELKEELEKIELSRTKAEENFMKQWEAINLSLKKAEERVERAEQKLNEGKIERASRKRERKLSKKRDMCKIKSVNVEVHQPMDGNVQNNNEYMRGALSNMESIMNIATSNKFAVLSEDDDGSDKSTGLTLEAAKKRSCNNARTNVTVQAITGQTRSIRRKTMKTMERQEEESQTEAEEEMELQQEVEEEEIESENDEADIQSVSSVVPTSEDEEDDGANAVPAAKKAQIAAKATPGEKPKNSPTIVVDKMSTPQFMTAMKVVNS